MNPLQYLKPVLSAAKFGLTAETDNSKAPQLAGTINTVAQAAAATQPAQDEQPAKSSVWDPC